MKTTTTTNTSLYEEIEETPECREYEDSHDGSVPASGWKLDANLIPIDAKSGMYNDTLAHYEKINKTYAMHDEDAIRKLGAAATAGDAKAQERLVYGTIYIPLSIAKSRYAKLARGGVAQMAVNITAVDLMQAAVEGLLEAINRMDWENTECKFSTYATYWVSNRVTRFVYDMSHDIHIPNGRIRDVTLVKDTRKRLLNKLGREPNVDEIYVYLEGSLRKERIREAIRMSDTTYTVSLDARLGESGGKADEDEVEFVDFLEDTAVEAPDKVIERKEAVAAVRAAIESKLTPREKLVIEHAYGLGGKKAMSLIEVSDVLKEAGIRNRSGECMSREGVRLIKMTAFKKLKQELRSFGENSRLENLLR